MRTKPIHLTVEECALMCNLLGAAMSATGKPFVEQARQVQLLSTKLAKSYAEHERHAPIKKQSSIFDKPKEDAQDVLEKIRMSIVQTTPDGAVLQEGTDSL